MLITLVRESIIHLHPKDVGDKIHLTRARGHMEKTFGDPAYVQPLLPRVSGDTSFARLKFRRSIPIPVSRVIDQ